LIGKLFFQTESQNWKGDDPRSPEKVKTNVGASNLKDFLLNRCENVTASASDDDRILNSNGTLPWKNDFRLHSKSHPFLKRIGLTLGQERQLIQLQADAVPYETGLESRGAQVSVLVTQFLRQVKGLLKNRLAICSRPSLLQ
jgi:hypothetical protein